MKHQKRSSELKTALKGKVDPDIRWLRLLGPKLSSNIQPNDRASQGWDKAPPARQKPACKQACKQALKPWLLLSGFVSLGWSTSPLVHTKERPSRVAPALVGERGSEATYGTMKDAGPLGRNWGNAREAHPAGVFRLDMRVVEELYSFHVAPAQSGAEVDGPLWRSWKSSEGQVVVEVTQLRTVEAQPDGGRPRVQGPVLEAHRTLGKAQTRAIKPDGTK